ncbi:MAG: hypothetical protein KDE19_02730 [Caldilineaceae bacterium]|nr:hypothetical protein [Caldilineaceae bacterium]
MMEVVYEYAESWPQSGPMQVTVPSVTVDIPVSPDIARRRANGYLSVHIGLLLGTSNPRLVVGDPPIWKLAVNLHLPSVGYVSQVGTIAVDAINGDVIPVTQETIQSIKDRAHDLIVHSRK